MQKLVKTQKSTNNPMSIFGLKKERMELSHIHLAVPFIFHWCLKICFFLLYFETERLQQLSQPIYYTHTEMPLGFQIWVGKQ